MEMSGAVEAENARAISADHPLGTDRDDRGDPVVLKIGRRSRVVGGDVALVQYRQATERAGHEFVPGNAERVDMVVDQSVKRVHAARAAGVEESKPSRSRKREAVAVSGDVRNVVGDQAIGARQHLLLASGIVETNQAVRGGNIDGGSLGIWKDPVHAEYVLIFYMA